MIKKYPNEILVLEIGPSTNLSKAYLKDAETFNKLKGILMMGGSNNHFAEWNIRSDAEAFKYILSSKVDLTLIPIDVTKHTTLTPLEEKILTSSNDILIFQVSLILKTRQRKHLIILLHIL